MNRYRSSKSKVYRANTKSEARAQMKAELGIPRKGRLPVGTLLVLEAKNQ